MVSSPSYLKTLHPLQVFSTKLFSPSSSSTLSLMKVKTLIHTLIVSHMCGVIRALSKAKSILIQILKELNQPMQLLYLSKDNKRNKHKNMKLFLGSFRFHYNWCSSHVLPVPAPVLNECVYYDPSWNSAITCQEDMNSESQLSGYLQWLEEKKGKGVEGESCTANEIDRLADIFIANCHEKFRLEKQESYRRYQEMMARSM